MFSTQSKIFLKVTKEKYEESNFRQFHKQAWEHRIFIIETLKNRLINDKSTEEGIFLMISADENLENARRKKTAV